MIVAVTGSSGLVGSALVAGLEADGHFVRPVVRRAANDAKHEIGWDPTAGTIDTAELASVDGLVHLAGESIVARRWTPAFKDKILSSRVGPTRALCEAIAAMATKPSVIVCASAIGYYGSRGDVPVDELSPPGEGFLAEVCKEWEAATQPARGAGIRVVNLRIGFVLAKEGGGLAKMLTPFKLGLGGVIGSGKQYMSWIALDDLVRTIKFSLSSPAVTGPVNATSPQPVTNREFTKTLGRVLKRPTIFPMPSFAARLAFGEMADEMLLSSTRVEPHVLEAARFDFIYPQLEVALRHILM
jgi:uncharacterized protein